MNDELETFMKYWRMLVGHMDTLELLEAYQGHLERNGWRKLSAKELEAYHQVHEFDDVLKKAGL